MRKQGSGHQPGRIPLGLMLVLGVMATSAALSTDLYLPSFPVMADAFGVGPTTVQLTLTSFMVGLALGQLVVGTLSDAIGRRTTLLVGLTLFSICSLAAGFSPSIEVLIAVRALQGFSAASGAVLARAIISDLSTPSEAARAFSLLFVIMSLGPAVASPLGALLTEAGGWQAPLFGLGVIATCILILATFTVPESLPIERRQPFRIGVLLRNLKRLVTSPNSLGYAIAFGAGYGGLVVYLSSSSFVAQGIFGLSPTEYSLIFVGTSASFMLGAWTGGKLVARMGGHKTLRVAHSLHLGSAAIGLTLALTGLLGLPAYIAMVVLLTAGAGMIMSTASALTIAQAVGIAGAGSALVGFSQFFFGAIAAPMSGAFGVDSTVPSMVVMVTVATISVSGTVMAGRALRSKVS